jgi:rubrerythrin
MCGKIAQSKGHKILQVFSEVKSIDMVSMMLDSSENEEVIKVIKDLSKMEAAVKSILRHFGL